MLAIRAIDTIAAIATYLRSFNLANATSVSKTLATGVRTKSRIPIVMIDLPSFSEDSLKKP